MGPLQLLCPFRAHLLGPTGASLRPAGKARKGMRKKKVSMLYAVTQAFSPPGAVYLRGSALAVLPPGSPPAAAGREAHPRLRRCGAARPARALPSVRRMQARNLRASLGARGSPSRGLGDVSGQGAVKMGGRSSSPIPASHRTERRCGRPVGARPPAAAPPLRPGSTHGFPARGRRARGRNG